jgi:hypothetical protein
MVVAVRYAEQQFRDITPGPAWAGGQNDGRIQIPVAGSSRQPEPFDKVLTHELRHAIMAGIAPSGVPARLNEGLAQQFDGTDVSARSGDENTRPTDTAESPRGWIRDAVTLPRHKSRRTRVFWPSTSWLDDRLSAGCGCHRSAGGHPSTT